LSSAEIAARIVKSLEPDDYKIMRTLYSSLSHHKSLSKDQIVNYSGIHKDIVEYRIRRLNAMKLVFNNNKNEISLVMAGLDAMALKTLAKRNIILAIGRSLGIGKESDVFEAVTENGETRAIKFFRIGRISFRQVRRKRSFLKDQNTNEWLLINTEAAAREYTALQMLKNTGVKVPTPYFRAMHSIVLMRIDDGLRLVDIRNLDDPRSILSKILDDVKVAYENNVINCDLSEYNILVDTKNDTWIIDWPQYVTKAHPNAHYLIRRDIYNIIKFFNRRFHLEIDWKLAVKGVSKESI
jgi:RIO kinase 2